VSEIIIKAENLCKDYKIYNSPLDRLIEKATFGRMKRCRYHRALEDVNFTVRKGESLGLIGRNGAGKTTLLKIISNISNHTSGSISVRGRVNALMALGAGLCKDFTGKYNVYIMGRMLGLTGKQLESKYQEIVEFSELADVMDDPVRTYSTGMQMRLSFSVSTCIEPDILVIDEALSVGDAAFARKCLDRIYQLKRKARNLLFVSHDYSLTHQLCDRAIWLEAGRVMHDGPADESFDKYLDFLREETKKHAARLEKKEGAFMGQGGLRLKACKLYNETGQEQYWFDTGNPLTIKFFYETDHEDFPEPILNFAITREDGVIVYNYRSHDEGFKMERFYRKGVITVRIAPFLCGPGNYSIACAFHGHNDEPLWFWPLKFNNSACRFTVLPNTNKSIIAVLRQPATWKNECIEGESV